jgi:predicted glutamine amidotransferase
MKSTPGSGNRSLVLPPFDTVACMCRLFGMSGGRERVRATFWLLEAPDSLANQSRREPDGTGVGTFDEHGHPEVYKQPLAAYEDQLFAQEARELCSRTFIAHIRYASTGAVSPQNTHPFEQRDRLFAHNGVIGDVPALEHHLGDTATLVRGETDSERYFALITSEIERAGDVGEGIVSAASWIAQHLPVFALNCVLITESDLWALRYPDVHELHVLERAAGGVSRRRHLEHASARGAIRVRCGDLATRRTVVVASEPMDEDPAWRALGSGELVHVAADLRATVTRPLPNPPAHQLTLADLGDRAAASQAPASRL